MANSFVQFPGLPTSFWQFGHVVCAEFNDWKSPAPHEWVQLAENIANVLGVPQNHGNTFGGDITNNGAVGPKSSGAWKRIRKRSAKILSEDAAYHCMNIDSGYSYIVSENFDDGYIALVTYTDSDHKRSRLTVVVANQIAMTPDELIQKISPILAGKIDAKYGAVYNFPRAAGGNFYINGTSFTDEDVRGLGGVPRAHSFRAGGAQSRSYQFPYSAGYIREVFEINFLSENHLNKPLLGSTVLGYVEGTGSLTKSVMFEGLWEWRLDDDQLAKARIDWEQSGLVLAAERPPLS